uniref:Capsular polysaccharide biosynthesis protein-like protein n=1 Tax=Cyanothece sp. (strain PCC 7425 / ATCC 29141) TaxID=395961 RepID=B8HQ85_CYAP4
MISKQNLKSRLKDCHDFLIYSLLKFLRFLPCSSAWLGPPKGVWSSTQQAIQSLKPTAPAAYTYTEFYASHSVELEPVAIETCPPPRTFYNRFLPPQSKPGFVAVLPEGRVWSEHGCVIAADDRLLADVSADLGYHRTNWVSGPESHFIFRQARLGPLTDLRQIVAVLAALGQGSYFHWMFEVLPRIELLRQSAFGLDGIDQFVFGEINQNFQQETLNHLGIPTEKIIQITPTSPQHFRAAQLVVPSLWGYQGSLPKWICEFLRREFLPIPPEEQLPSACPYLYISRASASHRRILNEAEVMQFLAPLGFQSIDLEQLSVLERAQLFAGAKVIIAPHGGALTNLVFCSAGTTVIQFFTTSTINCCYWPISSHRKLNHYYFCGSDRRQTGQQNPHRDDVCINLRDLERAVEFSLHPTPSGSLAEV